MFNQKLFRERLRELRKEKGLKQEELGEMINLSKQAISNFETGQRSPSIDTICLLAEILGVSTDYLLGRTDKR